MVQEGLGLTSVFTHGFHASVGARGTVLYFVRRTRICHMTYMHTTRDIFSMQLYNAYFVTHGCVCVRIRAHVCVRGCLRRRNSIQVFLMMSEVQVQLVSLSRVYICALCLYWVHQKCSNKLHKLFKHGANVLQWILGNVRSSNRIHTYPKCVHCSHIRC